MKDIFLSFTDRVRLLIEEGYIEEQELTIETKTCRFVSDDTDYPATIRLFISDRLVFSYDATHMYALDMESGAKRVVFCNGGNDDVVGSFDINDGIITIDYNDEADLYVLKYVKLYVDEIADISEPDKFLESYPRLSYELYPVVVTDDNTGIASTMYLADLYVKKAYHTPRESVARFSDESIEKLTTSILYIIRDIKQNALWAFTDSIDHVAINTTLYKFINFDSMSGIILAKITKDGVSEEKTCYPLTDIKSLSNCVPYSINNDHTNLPNAALAIGDLIYVFDKNGFKRAEDRKTSPLAQVVGSSYNTYDKSIAYRFNYIAANAYSTTQLYNAERLTSKDTIDTLESLIIDINKLKLELSKIKLSKIKIADIFFGFVSDEFKPFSFTAITLDKYVETIRVTIESIESQDGGEF